jgi:hypothetical protein
MIFLLNAISYFLSGAMEAMIAVPWKNQNTTSGSLRITSKSTCYSKLKVIF